MRLTLTIQCRLAALMLMADALAASGMSAAAAQPEAEGARSASVQVVECPAHPELTAPAIKKIGLLRSDMLKLASEKDLMTPLSQPDVRADVIKKVERLYGVRDNDALKAAYDARLATVRAPLADIANIRRVFLYEISSLKARLRSGESVPYVGDLPGDDEFTVTWSLNEAQARGEPLDMPMVIVVPAKFESYDALIDKYLSRYRPVIEASLDLGYSYAGYAFLHGFATDVVQRHLSNCPHWYRIGLAHAMTIRLMSDLIGTRAALDAFNRAVPAPPDEAVPAKPDLDGWAEKSAPGAQELAYRRIATITVLRSLEQGGAKWMPQAVARLKKLSVADTKRLAETIKTAGNIDILKLVPAAADKK